MNQTAIAGPYMNDHPGSYHSAEQLRDGQPVVIRAIRPDDKERLRVAFEGLDPETIYTRLFTHKDELTGDDLKRLTEIDFESEVGLVVTRGAGDDEAIIGSGRYFAYQGADGRRLAEVAFVVEEDYQGQGMAGMILRHLTVIARDRGIVRFEAEVLPVNKAMLKVFARSGLPMKQVPGGDVVHVRLSLESPAV